MVRIWSHHGHPKPKPPNYAELADEFLPVSPERIWDADEHNIVHLARPIIEHVHEHPVDAVLAADRGGRLLALAMHTSWRYRYPGQRFPTQTGGIHFVRNSGDIAEATVLSAIHDVFNLAFSGTAKVPDQLSVLFVDDWIGGGATMARFAHAAFKYGLRAENVHTATMSGTTQDRDFRELAGTTHVSAQRVNVGNKWDGWNEILGITFDDGGITPRGIPSALSAQARQDMQAQIKTYYQPFTEALARQQSRVEASIMV